MQLLTLVGPVLFVLSADPAPAEERVDPSPHRSDSVVVNELTLQYLDWGGSGEPLLLLAGLFGSAHGFDDLAPQLTSDFRVLALTRRGHGKSGRPASGYSLAVLVDDICGFLDLMKIERVHQKWATRLSTNPLTRNRLPFPPAQACVSFSAFRDWYVREIGPWSPAVEADNREIYLAPDGSVNRYPAPLTIAQEVIASGMAAPPGYAAVKARALAIFTIPTRAEVPDDADAELRHRAQEFHDKVLVPMQREQIDALRKSRTNVTIVELTGTTHMRFMTAREREIVEAMKELS